MLYHIDPDTKVIEKLDGTVVDIIEETVEVDVKDILDSVTDLSDLIDYLEGLKALKKIEGE